MADMYTNVAYDEYSTITVRADGNTVKMLIKLNEDIEDEQLEEYTSEEATDNLKNMGAGFLTSLKPEVRGFGGEVRVGVKKGDETVNYVKMSYREAKKFLEEQEEQAEEDTEAAEDAAEDAEDASEEADD
jgi:bisphosphoglycerate-dependent phosphoglycerate mutase